MTQLIQHIENILGSKIKQPVIFETAFNHTSYVNEQKNPDLLHNERLEFLGDAILELLTSDFLFHQYPNDPEGSLSRMRAQLVQEASLAYLAKKLKFHQFIKLGKGELTSGGNQRDSILADCFEAFLGAIYLDQGLEKVKEFLQQYMFANHRQIIEQITIDYKTRFQEKAQQQGSVLIQYQLLEQSGPAHNQLFKVGLFVNNALVSIGIGKNKKAAEMLAAKNGFNQIDERGQVINVLKQN
ncbi:ribonuclease III [Fundicoccus culcitae]|uniref:Ribonuclease 3 n=1 Tax=Fundicoccus culcitae TaxID=2969821 RepID=A0ABY5P5S3_9LACT|nr:ribonuclease III [Fundicoccus culcitae]UUX34097.1 ribonuclease III [Fundicoccus culcitae]